MMEKELSYEIDPNGVASSMVRTAVTIPDKYVTGMIANTLAMIWKFSYGSRAETFRYDVDTIKEIAGKFRSADQLSINDIFRAFGLVGRFDSLDADQFRLNEIAHSIERDAMERHIHRGVRLQREIEEGPAIIFVDLPSSSRPKKKKSKQDKRRRHELAKQRKLARKRSRAKKQR